MHTVVALAKQPMIEFSISFAGVLGYREDLTRLICSNSVHVSPFGWIL